MADNPMTKALWEHVETELKSYFCHVQFRYQNTVITVTRERDGESRTVLSVYFDGTQCAGWGHEGSDAFNPLTRQFWSEKKRRLYSAKRVAEIEKAFGKRRAKAYFPELHGHVRFRLPFFSSSSVLVRQFRKVEGLVLITQPVEA